MASKLLCTSLIAVLSLCVPAAARGDAPRPLIFPGRVAAAEQVGVDARVAAAVDKVNVDIGDRVKKGQVLVELSAPELKDDADAAAAKLDQAKAEVDRAEAAAQAVKARMAQADAAVEAARAAVAGAKATADLAKADADRARELLRSQTGAISKEDFDARLHRADAAKAALEEAEAQVKTAEAARDAAAAEVAQAQAGVKVAQAGAKVAEVGVRQAQTRLDYTRLTAPFDGVVTRRLVDTGAVVGPAKPGETAPLLTVMRDDVVHVVFDVDERSAAQVAVGRP